MSMSEEPDLISTLPDSLLSDIVSLLPGTEGVRTCVLSHRWKMVWKNISHLTFNQRLMLKHLIDAYLEKTHLSTRLVAAFTRKIVPYGDRENKDPIAQAEMLINSVLDSHLGSLKRCTLVHMPESCASGEAVAWMKKLAEQKRVKELSMERDGPIDLNSVPQLRTVLRDLGRTLDIPFEIFSSFEALELKNYYVKTSPSGAVPGQTLKTLTLTNVNVEENAWDGILSYCSSLENITLGECSFGVVKISSPRLKLFKIGKMVVNEINVRARNLVVLEIDTVVCNPQKVIFETPNLQILSCFCDMTIGRRYVLPGQSKLLTSNEILKAFTGIQSSQGPTASFAGAFESLVILRIDLELKLIINAIALFSALQSCPKLQHLEINTQSYDAKNHFGGDYDDEPGNDDDILSYPKRLYWKRRELCECVENQLKTLCIRGFSGKGLEVEFLKYIITTSETIQKITVWFIDNCSWAEATETLCLLSFQKASKNLSIAINPGPSYMANVNGSFEQWVLSLRK
ncbi:putative F-box protein At1g67390 [Abrus precatorius]|uniref:F-box protein At1g67390 n=1 Tax=Abrus precatorius TaxID=3816 RepID=A0A8B8KJB2_ABRPR|nr:putative F-box protein At1g67390 [Abrus precatorius]